MVEFIPHIPAETPAWQDSPTLAAGLEAAAARLIERMLMSPDKDSDKWLTKTLLHR